MNCPSYKLKAGSHLLGIMNDDGEIDILKQLITVDQELMEQFSQFKSQPEEALRFTNTCIKDKCDQWKDEGCSIIRNAITKHEPSLKEKPVSAGLPDCPIRSNCRWYQQEGAIACGVCPKVVTRVVHYEEVE